MRFPRSNVVSILKLGVLISGRGSNLQALIQACNTPGFPAEIAVVISNRPNAPGLNFAAEAGLPVVTIDHKDFETRPAFEDELHASLQAHGVQLVCLAGFMRLLGNDFVNRWRDRMINIHPSLLPAYKGLHTHERALEDGVRITGCTVHFVRPEMDDGPIIMQAAVPVLPQDTPSLLAARVLEAEHRIYPAAVRMVADGKIRVSAGRVQLAAPVTAPRSLICPAPEETTTTA